MTRIKYKIKKIVLLILTYLMICGICLNNVFALDTFKVGRRTVRSATDLADARIQR